MALHDNIACDTIKGHMEDISRARWLMYHTKSAIILSVVTMSVHADMRYRQSFAGHNASLLKEPAVSLEGDDCYASAPAWMAPGAG